MKTIAALAFAMLGLALAAAAAQAQSDEDRAACTTDAQTICGQFIPDRERVAHCLIANKRRVSAGCRRALAHFK